MRKLLLALAAGALCCSVAWATPQWGRQNYPQTQGSQYPSQYPQTQGSQYPNQSQYPNGAQAVQITAGPRLENVTATTAMLAWSTNTGSSAIVHYGTDPNNLSMTAEAPWSNSTHRVTLNNLQPNTTYYVQVESAQGQGTGTGTMSPITQFHTGSQ